MNIVIVGGGTAGWMAALMAAKRHPNHKITVIDSTEIGIIGVGESTTGLITDLLTNHFWDFGCDHNEFIVETGASLKYAIKHQGWTNNIDDYYIGPIDGSYTKELLPDVYFSYGIEKFPDKQFILTSTIGHAIYNNMSNFSKDEKQFVSYTHALHVDAHLVGKYFKKVCLRSENANHIDAKVVDTILDPITGFIKSVKLEDGREIEGDFFLDCSGFKRILMSKLDNKWVSYQKHLPNNSAIPFLKEYEDGEYPDQSTRAWALSSGWMWTIPLLERTGNGYVFCDDFITPEKAYEEIESKVGSNIKPAPLIKFNTGRQESAWVKNCITIGLASAFIEPLEATSIHSTIVQIRNFVFEYLRPTVEETINDGSRQIYNQRTRKMFDDLKDFSVAHYMGGRTDSEYWRYISSGATKTEFVSNLLEMCKFRQPSSHDFPTYYGSAGWPLYSYVLAGIGKLNRDACAAELNLKSNVHGEYRRLTVQSFYDSQDEWTREQKKLMAWPEFIDYFRMLKKQHDSQSQ